MSKARYIAIVAAAASLGIVMSGVPVNSQQPPERQTIQTFDPRKTNYERFINEGKQGLSPGDTIMFVENQLDPETCEPVGKLIGKIQIIRIHGENDATFMGGFTMKLAGGKIIAEGVARFSEFESTDPIFAVTGGTETYKDASGEVVIQEGVTMCDKQGDLTTIDIGPQP